MQGYLEKCTKKQLYEFFEEFGATEESVKHDVEYIKEWLKQQPHLPNIDDEEMLTNVLLRSKNSVEKMKRMLENYYTIRAQMSELFEDRDLNAKELEDAFLHGPLTSLPKLTSKGYHVVVFRPLESSGDVVVNALAYLKSTQIVSDVTLNRFPHRGVITILDFRTMSAGYVAMIFPILNKLLQLTLDNMPTRILKFYVLNLNPVAVPLLKMAKSVMKKKLSDRFSIWSEKDTDLATVLPKEVLPAMYGGTEKSLEELRKLYLDDLKSRQEWLTLDGKIKADLSKKPSDIPFSDQSLFGIDGSFRKIAID